jgi:hypothetical protein
MLSAYGGLGLQAHLSKIQDTIVTPVSRILQSSTEAMRLDGVLTLGLGLQRRAGDVLLGIDFQIRQGVPAGYRSVDAFLSVGFFLDQGE